MSPEYENSQEGARYLGQAANHAKNAKSNLQIIFPHQLVNVNLAKSATIQEITPRLPLIFGVIELSRFTILILLLGFLVATIIYHREVGILEHPESKTARLRGSYAKSLELGAKAESGALTVDMIVDDTRETKEAGAQGPAPRKDTMKYEEKLAQIDEDKDQNKEDIFTIQPLRASTTSLEKRKTISRSLNTSSNTGMDVPSPPLCTILSPSEHSAHNSTGTVRLMIQLTQ
ncbi:uncharacterized protein BJ212DRAFT_1476854 [Suillus subaureus]|uniref:Uncharacterized protein n=1 Tax=Suillus subaureus TaxID=48587 RepID=A0A9P7EIC6_9AGAM|nr:uncharacterized protein BJ212DRAFT_1476854 [Suillus subaureus]KAG1822425.1 hypothetical protein BJ212DRAFT_1476854 [Suillus subaureus]